MSKREACYLPEEQPPTSSQDDGMVTGAVVSFRNHGRGRMHRDQSPEVRMTAGVFIMFSRI